MGAEGRQLADAREGTLDALGQTAHVSCWPVVQCAMRKILVGATFVVVLLAGCADAATDAGREDASTSPPAPAEAPSSADDETEAEAPEEATIRQWASHVAGAEGDVRDAIAEWDEDDCLAGIDEPICMSKMLVMSYTAQTLAVTIEGGMNEETPAFIGEPPAEISALVDSTHAAAAEAGEAAGEAFEVWDDAEATAAGARATQAYGRLISELDSWSPYMG